MIKIINAEFLEKLNDIVNNSELFHINSIYFSYQTDGIDYNIFINFLYLDVSFKVFNSHEVLSDKHDNEEDNVIENIQNKINKLASSLSRINIKSN